jgi:hypothetical protein
MKFICRSCQVADPCILKTKNTREGDPPSTCPFGEREGNPPKWMTKKEDKKTYGELSDITRS